MSTAKSTTPLGMWSPPFAVLVADVVEEAGFGVITPDPTGGGVGEEHVAVAEADGGHEAQPSGVAPGVGQLAPQVEDLDLLPLAHPHPAFAVDRDALPRSAGGPLSKERALGVEDLDRGVAHGMEAALEIEGNAAQRSLELVGRGALAPEVARRPEVHGRFLPSLVTAPSGRGRPSW